MLKKLQETIKTIISATKAINDLDNTPFSECNIQIYSENDFFDGSSIDFNGLSHEQHYKLKEFLKSMLEDVKDRYEILLIEMYRDFMEEKGLIEYVEEIKNLSDKIKGEL